MQLLLIGFCLMWILLCGRIWWNISKQNSLQRRLVAIGAGLGAALFYLTGMKLLHIVEHYREASSSVQPTSENVRISLPEKEE